MDMNGNGYLSLAEVDKGMRDVVKLPLLFKTKPVLIRAFVAAKRKSVSRSRHDDELITKGEFRYLLKYIRQYFEYWVMFDRIDTDDDNRIDFNEFKLAAPKMAAWGLDMSDIRARWKECDANGGGHVLFDEFCFWAIKNNLDLEDDDDADAEISEGEGTKPIEQQRRQPVRGKSMNQLSKYKLSFTFV
jgi:hypothetical protein